MIKSHIGKVKLVYDGTCNVRMVQDPMEGNGIFRGLSLLDNDISKIFTGLKDFGFLFPASDYVTLYKKHQSRSIEL